MPIDHSVLGATFEDRITPNGTASAAFTDDTAEADALTYGGTYKVVFLAFPLEAYGTAADKADLDDAHVRVLRAVGSRDRVRKGGRLRAAPFLVSECHSDGQYATTPRPVSAACFCSSAR